MRYSEKNSEKIELNEILLNINDIEIKENINNKICKQKNIYIDDNIINKIFFISNIKTTYFDKNKNIEDYQFTYYSLINNKNKSIYNSSFIKKNNNYTFLSFYKEILSKNIFIIFITIFLAIFSGILDFVQYIFLKDLLSLVNKYSFSDVSQYYILCMKFISFKIIHAIIQKNLYFYENYLPVKISNEITNLMYTKIISLQDINSQNNLLGKIINLIQTDTENISFIFNYGPSSLISPIQLFLVLFNIYSNYHDLYLIIELIVFLCFCFGLAFIIQKMYISSNTKYLYNKDIRIHSTNEIFNNLKEIKMNGLETFFENIIDKKREQELYHYNNIMKQGIANVFLFHNVGVFMTLILLIYIRIKTKKSAPNFNIMQADLIITLILMFNKLNYPLYRFPVFITGIIDSYISGKRIIEFLNTREKSTELYTNINIEEIRNKNICILGPNGGGKTTFIKYLMKKYKGEKISYCSQDKFILDKTIRENILFGNKLEKEKYLSVLADCQLIEDIINFKEKDLKECKINGIQLSGGQKSRVDLARAIYNDSQFYFFDDIFVSYDNKIRILIFNKVFIQKLKYKNKNIIASFSNINFLDKNNLKIFDYFIILDNKKIILKSDYNDFINSVSYSQMKNNSFNCDIINSKIEENINKDIFSNINEKKEENKKFFESKIIIAMKEIGYYFSFGLIFYQIIYQILELYKTKYILYNFKNFDKNKMTILDKYILLCVINIFFDFMINSTQYNATFYLNKKLTRKILSKILSIPLFSFLQLSKSSDIINRLSKDIEKIRYPLKFLQFVLRDIIGLLIISINIFTYSKFILLSIIINISLSFILFIYFIDKAKLYNNLERDSHSPLINLFTESLKGNIYIQVYQKENYFNDLLYKIMDKVLKINIFKFGSISMFQMYHEIICNINFLILLFIFMKEFINNRINKEEISILITFSLNLNESLCKLYRSILDLLLNKIYFDRLLQYDNIHQEINHLNKRAIPFSYGDIKFENVCMKYKKNSELILKNIFLNIKSGDKVAIIGRTGSGKSSIILCLLRMLQDNEIITGNISINGININDIDLKELRKKISVISQKPFIFNDCSIKENIDPDYYFKDNRTLFYKIKELKFMEKFVNKYLITEKDLNKNITCLSLSEGEKQIICLCRVMIKNNKIIIMDEATSNIDLETEKLIYDDFINKISEDTTIISILHKLDYINYYSNVIELSDKGTIKEN